MASQRHLTGIIAAPARLRDYPSYADLGTLDPIRDVRVFSWASWFIPPALDDEALINHYIVAGRLPDGLPVGALRFWDWMFHCYVPDNAIYCGAGWRDLSPGSEPGGGASAFYQGGLSRVGPDVRYTCRGGVQDGNLGIQDTC